MSSQQPESSTAPAVATSDASQTPASGQGIGKLIRRFTTKRDGSKRFSIFNKAGPSTAVTEGGDAAKGYVVNSPVASV
jgi:hypothetical protein